MSQGTLPRLDASKERNNSPHVVILGAGASLAAFPNGERHGQQLPLMKNIVEVADLQPILEKYDVKYQENDFEAFYDDLATKADNAKLLLELEKGLYDYFATLELPDEPTDYDYLILSLREKDIIATFNWDPFLALAFQRNMHLTDKMPRIVFLHGNVSVGCCIEHKQKGFLNDVNCPQCEKPLEPTKLLYPVKQKNYQKDNFINNEWQELQTHLKEAYLVTVWGYSAPITDVEAKQLMLDVWKKNTTKVFSAFHIIDIKDEEEVKANWQDFTAWSFSVGKSIWDEQLFHFPRRSCDAFAMATLQQSPWSENPYPKFTTLGDLQKWIKPLIGEEKNDGKLTSKGQKD